MKWKEVQAILEHIGVSTEGVVPTSKGQVSVSCPLAPWTHKSDVDEHPSLSVNVSKTPSVFHCFACGESGKLWSLVDTYATFKKDPVLQRYALSILVHDEPTLGMKLSDAVDGMEHWVPEYIPSRATSLDKSILTWPSWIDDEYSCRYVIARGIWGRVADRYDLRVAHERVIFPVYDLNGGLVGAVGRSVAPEIVEPKYYNYFGFEVGSCLGGLQHVRKETSAILVVEGFFDLLNCHEWCHDRMDVVCTFGASMSAVQADLLLSLNKSLYIKYNNNTTKNHN